MWKRPTGLALVVVLAIALRATHLGWPPMWADEAESAINALTVVATGLPGDRYLGQPIFENLLVRPCPESEEYEFRDVSYSDRGLAIYHGWIPLYAMAGAFRLAGVTPDEARGGPPVADGSLAELVHWTAVPRWPAIAFSALLVLFAFGLGRRVGGEGAGWAMAVASAISGLLVWTGRQARYYSPQVALTAACGLAIWNACLRGRPRDHALAGLALALLFHTHAVSAVTMGALYLVAVSFARLQPDRLRKLALGGAVAAGLVLPWALWAGFFQVAGALPSARELMGPGAMLRAIPGSALAAAGLALASLGAAAVLPGSVGERWRGALTDLRPGLSFAAAWTVLGYAGFVALIPAGSFFPLRLKLAVVVPVALLASLLVSAACRAALPSAPPAVAGVAMLAMLVVSGQARLSVNRPFEGTDEYAAARLIRSWPLGPEARVCAQPNTHLVLTYYSGRPVQSVAAIRKSWIEGFEGDLVVLSGVRHELLPEAEVLDRSRAHGVDLDPSEAWARSREVRRLATVVDLAGTVPGIGAPYLTPLERDLVEAAQARTVQQIARAHRGTPMEDLPGDNWIDFFHSFFSWFAGEGKREAEPNFMERARRGRAHVLPSGWVVYDLRSHPEPPLVPGREQDEAP